MFIFSFFNITPIGNTLFQMEIAKLDTSRADLEENVLAQLTPQEVNVLAYLREAGLKMRGLS